MLVRVPVCGVLVRVPVCGVLVRVPVCGVLVRMPVCGVLVRVPVCGVLVCRLVKGEVHRWVLCFRIPQRDLLLLLFGLSNRCKHFFLFLPVPVLVFRVDILLPYVPCLHS